MSKNGFLANIFSKNNKENNNIDVKTNTNVINSNVIESISLNNFIIIDGVLKKYLGNDEVVSIPQKVKVIGESVFRNNFDITTVIVPDSVVKIEKSAFEFSSLEKIILSDNLQVIEANAFYQCQYLEEIEIPNHIKEIDINTFCSCSALKRVKLSEGITKICDGAFCLCENLHDIKIPTSVKYIGDSAFTCTGIKSVILSENVEHIDNFVFGDCKNLQSIEVDINNNFYSSLDGVLFSKLMDTLITYPSAKSGDYIVPIEVIEIKTCAFYNNPYLTKVHMTDNIIEIEDGTFDECINILISAPINSNSYKYALNKGLKIINTVEKNKNSENNVANVNNNIGLVNRKIHSFRNSDWGDSIEAVKLVETTELIEESFEGLIFTTILLDISVYALYFFGNEGLNRGAYSFTNKFEDGSQYIEEYSRFKNMLIQIYGVPYIDEIQKLADENLIELTGLAKSLENGYVFYNCKWQTETTNICMYLHYDKYEPTFLLVYDKIDIGSNDYTFGL